MQGGYGMMGQAWRILGMQRHQQHQHQHQHDDDGGKSGGGRLEEPAIASDY